MNGLRIRWLVLYRRSGRTSGCMESIQNVQPGHEVHSTQVHQIVRYWSLLLHKIEVDRYTKYWGGVMRIT